jgi:hypothetical protein
MTEVEKQGRAMIRKPERSAEPAGTSVELFNVEYLY